MLEQEVRRQAMLQVMGLEVWLPRQPLPHARMPRPQLLHWQPPGETTSTPVIAAPAQVAAAAEPVISATPAAAVSSSARAQASLQQVRQSLESGQQSSRRLPESMVNTETDEAVPELTAVAPVEIPRFSLQLLRSGPCLLLADLPLGEAFQSSDPDFQLLKDLVRAAGLPQQLQSLRQGEPIRWPLLKAGELAGTQDAAAARACVRDLLEFECSHASVSFVWLLGPRAVAFANVGDNTDADLFSVTAFQGGVRLWNLPSLEQLMSQQQLKPELWQHMQKLMAHWSQQHA